MKSFSKQYKYEQAQQRAMFKNLHVGATVQVLAFDKKKMTLTVQPTSQRLEDGEYAAPSQILKVPVSFTRSGGFIIRPWFEKNDFGNGLYLDHDMDEAVKTGNTCKPNTERSHSDSDMIFQGGLITEDFECPDIPDGLALCKEDGELYFVLTPEKFLIKGDAEWEGDIIVYGDVTINGNLTVNNGDITVNNGDVIADGVSLKHHIHKEVMPGDGVSGEPVQ